MGRRSTISVGDKFSTNKCGDVVVTGVRKGGVVSVTFLDTGFSREVLATKLREGACVDTTVAFIKGRKRRHPLWGHPSYDVWRFLIKKTSEQYQFQNENGYSVRGVSLHPSFEDPLSFRDWYDQQPFAGARDYLGKSYHIEKDILFPGNMVYAPARCVFVPPVVNAFFSGTVQMTQPTPTIYTSTKGKGTTVRWGRTFDAWPGIHIKFPQRCSAEESLADYYHAKRQHALFLAETFASLVDERVIHALETFTVEKYLIAKQEWLSADDIALNTQRLVTMNPPGIHLDIFD